MESYKLILCVLSIFAVLVMASADTVDDVIIPEEAVEDDSGIVQLDNGNGESHSRPKRFLLLAYLIGIKKGLKYGGYYPAQPVYYHPPVDPYYSYRGAGYGKYYKKG